MGATHGEFKNETASWKNANDVCLLRILRVDQTANMA